MRGRRALITGTSRGIGLAIAERFREARAEVLSPTRQEMNLSSNSSIDQYLQSLSQGVDILVNNAGINPLAGIAEVSDGDIADTIQVNLIAPLRLIRGLVPYMKENHYGRIINISSIFGIVSKQRRIIYSATKSSLIGMTTSLAIELAPFGILINSVAPGYVDTELTRQNNTPEQLEAIRETIPLGRLAEPYEIAEVVTFLCSEKNSYITGQVVVVDGGFTCT